MDKAIALVGAIGVALILIEAWVEGASVSLTPRLDKNGKPYIDPKWKNH